VQFPGVTPRAFLRITQVTVVIVVINIVTGAAVRLSDSGLGCPDWPTCSKHSLTPQLSLHPAIEFGNRMVVVVLCIATALAVLAALRRTPRRRDLVWLSAGLLGGVLGEAVLGAVVVYTKLNPYVVMTHFMVGIALLTDAFVLALRAGRPDGGGTAVSKVGRRERRISQAMVGLLVVAIAAGTATTGAGPHAGGKGAKRLPIALEEVARIHSGIVICLVALTIALLYLLDHTGAPSSVLERARVLLGAMVLQGGIGYAQYFTHLPALLVGVHVFGATVVWMAMLWFYDGLTHHAALLRPEDEVSGMAGMAGMAGPAGPAGIGDHGTTAVPSMGPKPSTPVSP
jgi:cytochrome c oxidase assembly protein subunit 15